MLPAATVTSISRNDAMRKWWGLILYRAHEFSKNSDDAPKKDGRQRRHQIRSSGYLLKAQPSNAKLDTKNWDKRLFKVSPHMCEFALCYTYASWKHLLNVSINSSVAKRNKDLQMSPNISVSFRKPNNLNWCFALNGLNDEKLAKSSASEGLQHKLRHAELEQKSWSFNTINISELKNLAPRVASVIRSIGPKKYSLTCDCKQPLREGWLNTPEHLLLAALYMEKFSYCDDRSDYTSSFAVDDVRSRTRFVFPDQLSNIINLPRCSKYRLFEYISCTNFVVQNKRLTSKLRSYTFIFTYAIQNSKFCNSYNHSFLYL
ncbi:hypothetical protein EGR_10581 [Echinococcus granulosus]|uniref:Uncharacterized protein n=1 Tax=Echinococcus granulosus TaxID=6210 RepID=W6U0C1_ECHGR|nr:hypothetical protein EGR_10581 [Echinococcus granulosus]EUB54555.1 hypothetical protein EGR_10581 [Echinococcus granulosus]